MCDAHADYDVLLLDAVLWPAAILTELLKVPMIDVLSMGPFQPGTGVLWSSPNPVAYLPQISSGLVPGMVSSACFTPRFSKMCMISQSCGLQPLIAWSSSKPHDLSMSIELLLTS